MNHGIKTLIIVDKARLRIINKRIEELKEKGDPKAFEDPLTIKESEIK